ncbi:contactin-associated protein-like 5 [Salmo salar]|uniref:Contactin-associated protein-like 5 n=1 Tax=Salmo salar TaxID=8030 RepID=A0A1S3PMJ7_SALSA|nr:contactin-associated protein-like 5 [Salmo salar]|eukprot:XP_014028887.1 PREDICTED: contactin-associated protein-like 5 isoform X1 [Salmo salar]
MELRKLSRLYIFIVCLLSVSSSASAASHYICNGPLVSMLPPASLESSSQSSVSNAPHFAKINRRDGAGGWSPQVTDSQPWLQLDLRDRMEVTAVATQGRYGSSDWVSGYLLLFSDTGQAWKQYRQEDGVGRFVGNVNADSVIHHKLFHSIRSRFLRFVPLDWNPSGWVGLRVEVYGCVYKSDVADFDGRSSLLYRFNQKSMSTVKDVISLRFKSHQAEGVLLHGEGQRGDYITLELHRGRLALYLNLDDTRLRFSSGRVAVTLGSLLDDQHWHSVLIERFNKQVNLTMDTHTQHFRTKGEGDSLEVDYELSFGGIPLPGKPGTFLRKNFHGCIENLYYNGINIIDLAKRRKPQIYSVGNVTFSCSEPQLVSTTFLSSSSSFLSLPATQSASAGFAVRFQFRTWNPDGLLLSTQLSLEPQRLDLQISNSRLRLTHHTSAQQKEEVSTGHRVNDGLWHSVSLSSQGLQVTTTLDNEPSSTIELGDHMEAGNSLYFGGCPSLNILGCENPTLAFQGCMRLISINSQPMDLNRVQQGRLGNYKELQFDTCGIHDRCLPNFCEHGGQCSQFWNTFYCDCSGTGYTGATCHNSIYEASCEAYRLTGSSSGFFSVDPDGSGPLGPTQVYCNMTEDKVWTVVTHNSTDPVRVQGSTLQKPYVMKFNYSASPEQLMTLVAGSEQCQQEVMYGCRKSRLFNTRDGTPLSWWVDQGGERRTYWGGFLPGVQQCSCSLEENCMDMNYFCNCDADTDSWANDTGVLSYKEHLPVSEIVIGDTNRTGSEALYRIGPLRCYGDKSVWNAVSFYQESSYLHFPTLQAELSADISFYFKTSVPSGVFLENLGLKHFIRLELSSPSVVTFSFDVGNGPVVLAVKSHVPLNDRQWHYLRAERSVKEASLHVDQLPLRFLEAPSDRHLRLRLNSQLFVGGTAARQRGFLGCIRTLTINSVTFNLEERAKMTPGVSVGCPGHCSGSSSLCHNRGRCIEKNSGYVCDCSQSAYGGPSCKEEVSVSFDRDSSVTYTFQEPFSVMQNRSSLASRVYRESGRARENIAFSFMTTHSPAMLLTVSTFSQQYIAVILARNGSLQIWYRLHVDRKPDVFSPSPSSLADRRLHRIRIHRQGKDVYLQIDKDMNLKYSLSSDAELISIKSLTLGKVIGVDAVDEEVMRAGSKGFIGCLSSVQFNHMAPLKAVLLNRGSSLVTVRGHLMESNCGTLADLTILHSQSDHSETVSRGKGPLRKASKNNSVVIGGVVSAVVFITLCVVAVMTRFLYQHRQAQRDASIKEKEHRHNLETAYRREAAYQAEPAYRTELHLHHSSTLRDNREYYI